VGLSLHWFLALAHAATCRRFWAAALATPTTCNSTAKPPGPTTHHFHYPHTPHLLTPPELRQAGRRGTPASNLLHFPLHAHALHYLPACCKLPLVGRPSPQLHGDFPSCRRKSTGLHCCCNALRAATAGALRTPPGGRAALRTSPPPPSPSILHRLLLFLGRAAPLARADGRRVVRGCSGALLNTADSSLARMLTILDGS